MKTLKTLFTIALSAGLLLFASCTMYTSKELGPKKTKTYQLKDFNKLQLLSVDEVSFVPDSIYYVEVSAPEKLMSQISAKVQKDSTLLIGKEGSTIVRLNATSISVNGEPLTRAVIHAPSLEKVSTEGSTWFKVEKPLSTHRLKVEVAGSGIVQIPRLVCDNFKVSIAGSGDIQADSVSCKSFNANIAGSGSIRGTIAGAQTSKMMIAGSGLIKLKLDNCREALAEIAGSGDINLSGTVGVLKKNVAGSGNVDDTKLKTNAYKPQSTNP